MRRASRVGLAVAVLLAGVAAAFAYRAASEDVADRARAATLAELAPKLPKEHTDRGYVRSDSCRECHEGEHATWFASHHRRMTTPALPENVLAPFDGADVEVRGRTYRPFREGDAYFFEMVDPVFEWTRRGGVRDPSKDAADPPARATKRVVMITGSHHQQVYWVEGGLKGQLDYAPIVWLVPERKWRAMGDVFLRHPDRPETLRFWNDTCIHCHGTDGVPKPYAVPGGYARATEVGELGIACESCHGPGEAHVAARRAERAAGGEPARPAGEADRTIANPARMDHERSSEVCGLCHAVTHSLDQERWYREGFRYRPGASLEETEIVLRPPEPAHQALIRARAAEDPHFVANSWWSDGEVRVSGREHSGLVASGCYTRGKISCVSCHAMHGYADRDDQLKPRRDGDAACTQCHDAARFADRAHTIHDASSDGARCMNCHMPHTTYGLQKAIRSHKVTRPSVAATLATGRPHACNLCHADRPLAWTEAEVARRYGGARIAVPAERTTVAEGARALAAGDAGERALYAWHFAWGPARAAGGAGWAEPLLRELLADDYVAVRHLAERALRAPSTDAPRAEAALLRRPDGTFDRAAFDRLRAVRDDRRMDLAE